MSSSFDVILFDVGGVLLTNGLDREERAYIFGKFGIDVTDFEARQRDVYALWNMGKMTVDAFLDTTIFYKPRDFSREEYWATVLEQSKLLPDGAMGILKELAISKKYLLGALNNEPRETNEYRFRHFGLNEYLRVRLSSCYLGLQKPDQAYYLRALDILGSPTERVLFIDDRSENVIGAQKAGMQAILFQGEAKLRTDLERLEVL